MTDNKEENKGIRCFFSEDIELFIDFFKKCNEEKISDSKEKERILFEMIKSRKYGKCMVTDFNKTKDQVVEHYSKVFGNVLNLSDRNKVEQFQKEVEASKMDMNKCPTCGSEMILLGYGWTCYNQYCSMNGCIIYNEYDAGSIEDAEQ